MNIKRIKAAVIAAATALTALASIPVMNVSATQMTFLQGDVNGDGTVNMVDAILLDKYLIGNLYCDSAYVTRMDTNSDLLIDALDKNKVVDYVLGVQTTSSVTVNQYTSAMNNVEQTYLKYNCSTGQQEQPYVLSPPSMRSIIEPYTVTTDVLDYENLNTVQISNSNGTTGSGFIVGDHVVATAAHCVVGYNQTFNSNVQIHVFDADSENSVSYTAKYIHVPKIYTDTLDEEVDGGVHEWLRTCYNYDYALIYVEENLSTHGIWNVGIATDEFMTSNTNLISSGFAYYNNVLRRLFYTGNVEQFTENHNSPDLRIDTTIDIQGGQSGGPMYLERSSTQKIVLGINSAQGGWCTRITPTVARFLLNNGNIE